MSVALSKSQEDYKRFYEQKAQEYYDTLSKQAEEHIANSLAAARGVAQDREKEAAHARDQLIATQREWERMLLSESEPISNRWMISATSTHY